MSPFRQDLTSKAHVMVVGCGALGNEVLKNLALMGVGNLVIVDFDRVEADNLSRSVLFTRGDAEAARLKVDAARDGLKRLNPDVNVLPVCGDIAYDVGLGLIRRMDVVIGCVDNRWARYCINRLCMRAGVPWVDGGIDGLEGTARVFMPGKNCYACNLGPEGLKDLARRMPCAGAIRRNMESGKVPTTSIVASVIGAVQVQEAMKLIHDSPIHGFTDSRVIESSSEQARSCESVNCEYVEGLTGLCGRMFYYEGQHLTTKLVDFEAWDDDCPVHGKWEVTEGVDVSRMMAVGDALTVLEKGLNAKEVSIGLGDDCFVDYVVRRDNNKRKEVMLPGRAVADFVAEDAELGTLPLSSLYQHEWREINRTFPYQHLTLAQLGIPPWAVLQVQTDKGEWCVEVKAVERFFEVSKRPEVERKS